MKPSRSAFIPVRALHYHVREWGIPGARKLFLLHGWMDVAASFQFVVDALAREWHVIAPDFRGFGLSEWPQDGYWFPDYLADLDALLEHFSPNSAVTLVGHSMGGNVACLYAGVRPERVAALISLEGFGLPASAAESAPERYGRWLAEIRDGVSFRRYASFEEYAARLQRDNVRLSNDQAEFLARHSAARADDASVRLLGDPRHKRSNATAYRLDEAKVCWQRVTAPVLWVGAADSAIFKRHQQHADDYAARKACFANLAEHVIGDCGHMMHHDRPEEVARVIEQFLD